MPLKRARQALDRLVGRSTSTEGDHPSPKILSEQQLPPLKELQAQVKSELKFMKKNLPRERILELYKKWKGLLADARSVGQEGEQWEALAQEHIRNLEGFSFAHIHAEIVAAKVLQQQEVGSLSLAIQRLESFMADVNNPVVFDKKKPELALTAEVMQLIQDLRAHKEVGDKLLHQSINTRKK